MQRGSLFVAVCLLVSGVLRIVGPGASAPTPQGHEPAQKTNTANTGKNTPRIPYLDKFNAKIGEFYGIGKNALGQDTSLASYLKTVQTSSDPAKQGPNFEPVQCVIAILPDPVHTRLGLFFDRSAEALQQAAQASDYVFDRSIMPWDRTPHTGWSDLKSRQEEIEEQAQRESYPGLLIFRPDISQDLQRRDPPLPQTSGSAKGPLFVLVVGETPTAGLNKEQFRNAVKIVREIREAFAVAGGAKNPPLLILGPSFSGSLESLQLELQQSDVKEMSSEKFIYSGTVTGTASICWFMRRIGPTSHFASFQENDDYARDKFLQFASDRGYQPNEIAILSEDETVFGVMSPPKRQNPAVEGTDEGTQETAASTGSRAGTLSAMQPEACPNANTDQPFDQNVLNLHFPREISYFRSAYQKSTATQQSAASSPAAVPILPTDLDESGNDVDTVAPYAVTQTSLSQEAVMLGIVSELQKHRIKFTLLFATDPLDELFLASYLRKAYAQGRVVITAPDLLFARAGDPALRGVLGLNAYSLIPGLSDRLCRQNLSLNRHENAMPDAHDDRLFVSSSNVGTFNAMAGLLAVQDTKGNVLTPDSKSQGKIAPKNGVSEISRDSVPFAPYEEYGSPILNNPFGTDYCQERPLLWLTILGRDGFWPVAGLSGQGFRSADGQVPLAPLKNDGQSASTLKTAAGSYSLLSSLQRPEMKSRTPRGWNIAYCLCVILLMLHAVLSWTGSILADSETSAQFARTTDCRGTIIIGLGALALASAFVLLVCTRSPRVDWVGFPWNTLLMWLPYPLFVAITIWDLRNLRHERVVAIWFTIIVCVMTCFQIVLTWIPSGSLRVYWSMRMLHLASGVSPELPVLLLMAAGYWWVWVSLRGVCLVDLRRPRLPENQDLPIDSYRISDNEGEELRRIAHPLVFSWQVLIPVLVLAGVSLIAFDRGHPVQTIEGEPYDWGFTILLGIMVAAFLGCLLKLVRTWQKCRQVLAGLDRLPLRFAFSRMKNLSWHSFWNPGGSTLRETYKVMSRALENLTHLLGLVENWNTPLAESARYKARVQIRKTLEAKQLLQEVYWKSFADKKKIAGSVNEPAKTVWMEMKAWCKDNFKRGWRLKTLMKSVESLQKEVAKTGGVFIRDVLSPMWLEDEATPSVSTDDRLAKTPLLPFRAMAEEYTALVYVNFLVSVLLRVRNLVITAAGLYVFIVLSVNVYPFEPHPALQTLAVVLLLVMCGAVGYVYAEMHRDTILSRLTSTAPGELGLDFWMKFASAAAIPVFSLLAAQFPSINQFLFSWLEPALQAMK